MKVFVACAGDCFVASLLAMTVCRQFLALLMHRSMGKGKKAALLGIADFGKRGRVAEGRLRTKSPSAVNQSLTGCWAVIFNAVVLGLGGPCGHLKERSAREMALTDRL